MEQSLASCDGKNALCIKSKRRLLLVTGLKLLVIILVTSLKLLVIILVTGLKLAYNVGNFCDLFPKLQKMR